ncbi:serine/threonine-protein kinase Nek7-like [Durio zibethinus]|uniref:Serine/threonine-protein kinase Nek7-like n=1 Tax=Durio zibethinus TaxID=66656 RepID=A0A6P5YUG9_DURZI|nr:serine/threonine-protein kinase Nek7-like [Durio zibethinus]
MKPTNSPKEKSPRKSLSSKPGIEKGRGVQDTGVSNGQENIHAFRTMADIHLSSSPSCEKPTSTASTEDNLVTKRVDPTSCVVKISNSISDSKDKSTDSEDAEVESTSEIAFNSQRDEREPTSAQQEEPISEHTQSLPEADIKSISKKDETFCDMQVLEAAKEFLDVQVLDRRCSSNKTSSPNAKTEGGDTSYLSLESSYLQPSVLMKLRVCGRIQVKQRADALESLLELCARLLKQDKIDELAGVLRPFVEDAVSSRETAICSSKERNEEAPTKEPRTAKLRIQRWRLWMGLEQAAGASVEAMTALMEAAATMTAQEIFCMSMMEKNKRTERPAFIWSKGE